MGYALDPSRLPTGLRRLPPKQAMAEAMQTHDSVSTRLAAILASPDGANASALLAPVLRAEPRQGAVIAAFADYGIEWTRAVFNVAFSADDAASVATPSQAGYGASCMGCFGRGYQTPMLGSPLLKRSGTTPDGDALWREYPRSERQAVLHCLVGASLNERVPESLRRVAESIAGKLDELRGQGALDEIVKSLAELEDHFDSPDLSGLRFLLFVSQENKLIAVAPLYHLTPYGRKIDCGTGPTLYSSDWHFAHAFGKLPKKPEIDYFRPCWWCRGSGSSQGQPWQFLSKAALISKMLWQPAGSTRRGKDAGLGMER